MKSMTKFMCGLYALVGLVSIAQAGPIYGTGDLANGVIYGSGNANGSFDGIVVDGIELALRGKQRYDLNGNPQNIFNYDGINTYTFAPLNSNAPANRSIWNFDFSIDLSNATEASDQSFSTTSYSFLLGIDTDPSANIANAFSLMGFDPNLYADNATNADQSVIQNSQNLGFGYTALDPQLPGIYTISLTAIDSQGLQSRTSIDIVVANAVPAPSVAFLLSFGVFLLTLRKLKK